MTTSRSTNEPPLIARIHQMLTDPLFARFHQLADEPNIFQIVGQKNYERWHSGFWAWLLDIHGSHGLGAYPIELFILHALTYAPEELQVQDIEEKRRHFLNVPMWDDHELNGFAINPNENNPLESSTEINGVNAFFDILIRGSGRHSDLNSSTPKDFAVLVEMKVNAISTRGQATRYADWFEQKYHDRKRLMVYVLPSSRVRKSVEATVGDPRWCIVTYQSLHDEVLAKILVHHKLSEHARWVIGEYIKNLRSERKGETMAITREERELAKAIYEKYAKTLLALQDALQSLNDETVAELDFTQNRRTGIEVKVGDKKIESKTFRELAGKVVEELIQSGRMDELLLPWGVGNSRYFIVRVDSDDAEEYVPQHINGNPFFQPTFVGTKPRYAIETNISRENGLKMLRRLCEEVNVKWEVVSQ